MEDRKRYKRSTLGAASVTMRGFRSAPCGAPSPAQPSLRVSTDLPCPALPCPALRCPASWDVAARPAFPYLTARDQEAVRRGGAWRGVAWRAVLALPLPCSTLIYSTPSPAPLQPYHNRSPQQQPRRPQPAARCEHPTYGWAGLLALPRLQQC